MCSRGAQFLEKFGACRNIPEVPIHAKIVIDAMSQALESAVGNGPLCGAPTCKRKAMYMPVDC